MDVSELGQHLTAEDITVGMKVVVYNSEFDAVIHRYTVLGPIHRRVPMESKDHLGGRAMLVEETLFGDVTSQTFAYTGDMGLTPYYTGVWSQVNRTYADPSQ